MKTIRLVSSALVLSALTITSLSAVESPLLEEGHYEGYAELYDIANRGLTIQSCDTLGTPCTLTVTAQGVEFLDDHFPWDVKGVQASRNATNGQIQRINRRGRFGSVFVIDYQITDMDGTVTQLIRICVAPKPNDHSD